MDSQSYPQVSFHTLQHFNYYDVSQGSHQVNLKTFLKFKDFPKKKKLHSVVQFNLQSATRKEQSSSEKVKPKAKFIKTCLWSQQVTMK